jgi:3-deoxy-manno-octulosonate cytidylyltransferase (CMP-KDO synthetase)
MIRHVYERAASCSDLTAVYVATDDERIFESVREFGGRAVMTYKEHPTGTDRISEAAQIIGASPEDIIVNIQGDQPMFHPSIVPALIEPLLMGSSIPMSTLKCKMTLEDDVLNPNQVKVVTDQQGFALYFSRSPIPFFRESGIQKKYHKHLGFYGFRMSFLLEFTRLPESALESAEKLEQLRALENGFRIKVVETPYSSIDVDVPEDIKRVEALLKG